MMKSNKLKKIVVSVDSDSICKEQVKTGIDILVVGQSVNWQVYDIKNCHKIQSKSTLFLRNFLRGMPHTSQLQDRALHNAICSDIF